MLCKLLSDERQYELRIAKFARTSTVGGSDWGRVFRALHAVRAQLVPLFARFGMTPADRSRVKVDMPKAPGEGKDEFFPTPMRLAR